MVGWFPAYTLPSKLEDYVVMRVVVRQGFSRDMADMLLNDIKNAICEFEKLEYPTPTPHRPRQEYRCKKVLCSLTMPIATPLKK